MQLQRNWVRPKTVETKTIDFKYYEHYDPFPNEFTGELFPHCKCISALSQIIKFKTKNGDEKETEKLELVFLIKDKYYFTHSIWGARKQSDGTWGANPVALQDFLYLCEVQQQHSTETSTEHETDWGVTQTLYPEIAGQFFTLVIAKVGERPYKERTYDVNYCDIFSDKGMSALEIQNGTTIPSEYKESHNRMRQKYCEYKSIAYQPVYDMTTGKLYQAQPAPVQAQTAPVLPATTTTTSAEPAPFNADDIPF